MPQIDFFATSQIQWITILVGADVVLGVLGAIVKKEFRLGKLGKFMHDGILKYVFSFAVLELTVKALPQFAFALQIAFVLVVLALIASLVRNLHKLGLPLPGTDWV